MLTREQFGEFFGAMNAGHPPFAWQERLLDHLLATGRWPEGITAPTGAGKTSVIDVHVFAQALSRRRVAPRLPRRLVITVNRRSIVDAHWTRAEHIAQVLVNAQPGTVVHEVAAALRAAESDVPMRVVGLRGGLVADRSWVDDPVSCMVLLATPDMWGSRLLFRGYGTSKLARPREAGLLAYDSAVVIDEAHLNRQLEMTARCVSRMAALADVGGVPPLQVISTTATPDESLNETVGVEQRDLTTRTDALTRRLTAPKPLSFVRVPDWKPGSPAVARQLVAQAIRAIPSAPTRGQPTTVLCVVNTIRTALQVSQSLAEHCGGERVALWVGRMRPHDLHTLQGERPHLFTVDGDPDIDVLVTTQTVEVGVDIDCAALVSEIAPGSAIAQRAGRVNRLGLLDEAPVVVIGPAESPTRDAPPYRNEDLARAHDWLQSLGQGSDVSPWSLASSPPPVEDLNRLVLSPLTVARAGILSETSVDHACDDDLAFWLRDDLDHESAPVGFAVRGPLPDDDADAMSLLASIPVDSVEVFPATLMTARQVLSGVLAHPEKGRAFIVRDETLIGVLREGEHGESASFAAAVGSAGAHDLGLRAGDTLVVDPGHALTVAGVVTADPAPRVGHIDVLWGGSRGSAVVEVRSQDEHSATPLLDAADSFREDHEEASVEDVNAAIVDLLPDESWRVLLPPLVTGVPVAWAAAVPTSELNKDPILRESWTVAEADVTLSQHQTAVAERARAIATACGLGNALTTALESAGAHHDDGKADLRFQRGALGAPDGVALAKGRWRSPQEARRSAARHGLPARWRHEQLSVVHADAALSDDKERDLVLRLVGTSHGHGRPFFPHGVGTLVGDRRGLGGGADDDLFATGAGWADIIERTHQEFGLWGAAYLEALLRAADCQVSQEGS